MEGKESGKKPEDS
jgi:hypothetical protein